MPGPRGGGREQVEIGPPVTVGEEHRQPAIAALGDVVRDPGNDDAGETGHCRRLTAMRRRVN